ncbi:hypothetical protein TCSYLVIO_004540 [Trypanosoma cruzi]|nr:hypothetical protein TCSYLVIO_004540 [Trypanosoma cruzi]
MGNCCGLRKASLDKVATTGRKGSGLEKYQKSSLKLKAQDVEKPLSKSPHASLYNSADPEERDDKFALAPLPPLKMNNDEGEDRTKVAGEKNKETDSPAIALDTGTENQREVANCEELEEADIYSNPEEVRDNAVEELQHSSSPVIDCDPIQPGKIITSFKKVSLALNDKHASESGSIGSSLDEAQEEEYSEKTETGFTSSVVVTVPPPSPPMRLRRSDSGSEDEGEDDESAADKEARDGHEGPVSSTIVLPTVVAPKTLWATDEEPSHTPGSQQSDGEGPKSITNPVLEANEEQKDAPSDDSAKNKKPEEVQPDIVITNKSCSDDSSSIGGGDGCSSGGNALANIVRQSLKREQQQVVARATGQVGGECTLNAHGNVVEYDLVFTDDQIVDGEDAGDNYLWDGDAEANGKGTPDATAHREPPMKIVTWSDEEDNGRGGGWVDARTKQENTGASAPNMGINAVECVDSGSSDDDSDGKSLVTVLYRSQPGREDGEKELKKNEAKMLPYDGFVVAKRKMQLVAVGKNSFLQDHSPVFVAEEALPPVRFRPTMIISPPPVTPNDRDANDKENGHLLF